MSRKIERPYNLILAVALVIGLGMALGISSLDVKISMIGAIIVTVAFLESALIVGGIAFFSRKHAQSATAGDPD